MQKKLANDLLASALALLGLLIVFYPTFFLVKAAPLTGDHWEQHYPWAMLLSHHLRSFSLPFWTSCIHSGFPIAAESQIGIFYLPNLLMYSLLPFHVAYSYMNIVHFFLAGFGTYLYAKRIGLTPQAAFLSCVLFTFGAAFGGAYYNMTSLKTISWFPGALFLFETFVVRRKFRYMIGLSFVIGQSLVAGYLQVALFTWLFFTLYAAIRFMSLEEHTIRIRAKLAFQLFVALMLAALLAWPQVYLTMNLAHMSSRVGLLEDYAYIGSLSPFSIFTMLDPVTQYAFRGNNLYMGLASLFFIALGITVSSKYQFAKIWVWMTVVSFLLALGRWSPLYVGIVKITHFYSFRVPAKFLGFVCFSLSIIAGFGYEYLRKADEHLAARMAKVRRFYYVFLGCFIVTAVVLFFFLTTGQHLLKAAGEWYLTHYYVGKSGHPRSVNEYFESLQGFLTVLRSLYSWHLAGNPRTMMWLGISVIFALLFRPQHLKKWLFSAFIFLFVDLYSFSWIDVKQDYNFYEKALKQDPIVSHLAALKNSGKLSRLYSFRKNGSSLPISPSSNMIYNIEDLGAYSPLVTSRYYESIGLMGNVNNSTTAFSPTTQYAVGRLPLLSALNVSHILSNERLIAPELEELRHEGSFYLYSLNRSHDKIFYHTSVQIFAEWTSLKEVFMSPHFDPSQMLLLEDSELSKLKDYKATGEMSSFKYSTIENRSEFLEWEIIVSQPGFFTVMDSMDDGWRATLDGNAATLLRSFGLFRSLYVPSAGKHLIRMTYQPYASVVKKWVRS